MRFEARLRAVQRLEQRERRRKAGPRQQLGQRQPAFAQIAGNGPQHHAGKDRGRDEAEDGQAEKDVGHADLRIPGQRPSSEDSSASMQPAHLRKLAISVSAVATGERATACAAVARGLATPPPACAWAQSPPAEPGAAWLEARQHLRCAHTPQSSASAGSSLPCARASAG